MADHAESASDGPRGKRGVWAVVALIGLIASYLVAIQRPVPEWELDLTVWINGCPDWVATILYPIMQLGTVIAPIGAAIAVAVFRRDWLLSVAVLVSGFGTWFLAKGIKKVVERGRPLEYIPGLDVREGTGAGLGYVSGHSAVAAVTAVVAGSALPRKWRIVPAILAVLVGIARIVHGVHLPADVIGGWSVGVLVGLGTLTLVDWLRPKVAADGR
jgi:glycosyltransferase 2 family protein